jgi:hypothetical protein
VVWLEWIWLARVWLACGSGRRKVPELRLGDLEQRSDAGRLDVESGGNAGVICSGIAEPQCDAEHER